MKRLQDLEADNLNLRNKLMDSNSQIFDLQASMMTLEAESKFFIESEIKKVQSESNFKV